MNWKRFISIVAVLCLLGAGGVAMSATYSDYVTGDVVLSKSAVEPVHNYLPFIDYRVFDMSSVAIHDGAGVTNNDVIKLFNVAANTYITEIGFRNLRALHTGTSAEIGDSADADGYIGNDYTSAGYAYLDLDQAASTGVSYWTNIGPFSSGASVFQFNGVSVFWQGGIGYSQPVVASNHGPYFKTGISPYVGKDTINMTIYVDKVVTPKTGVTPYFEAYIKGFKRVVP